MKTIEKTDIRFLIIALLNWKQETIIFQNFEIFKCRTSHKILERERQIN